MRWNIEKKLPKIFANTINKEFTNNNKIYKSETKNIKENKPYNDKTQFKFQKTINQKINEILKSKQYTYKIPVKIKTEKGEITKNVIGKNNHNLITIDNELIKIDDIIDIEISE